MPKHLGGWARPTTGIIKIDKYQFSSITDELEKIAEGRPFIVQEFEIKNSIKCTDCTPTSRRRV